MFRPALELSSDYLYIKDTKYRFRATNSNFAKLLHHDHWSELIGKTDFDVFSKSDAEKYRLDDQRVIEWGEPVIARIESYLKDDGSLGWVKTSKHPIRDDNGNIVGLFGFSAEISELIQAKKTAEFANQAKSIFLANISHELRTPMHAIHSFTKLALKRETDAKNRHFLENIDVSTQRLTYLLNDLLDLSKLESGKMELSLKKINLADVIINSVESLAVLAKEHKLIIDTSEVDKFDTWVDTKLMTQVIINLFSNAIKFSPENTTIKLSLQKLDTSLLFSIEDQGVGIPTVEHENIFDSFVQSSKTMTQAGGTGLGLPITKEIIELHNGKIWVVSPPKSKACGSVFYFQMPINPN